MYQVEKVLERINQLPLSPVVAKMLQLARDERAGVREMAGVISQDQAFTGRILRIANSPYYGQSRKVTTVSQAVSVLGFNTLKSLALTLHAFGPFVQEKDGTIGMKHLWEHSLGSAVWSRQVAVLVGQASPEETFVAGLMHDMGNVVFYRHFKKEFVEAVGMVENQGITLSEAQSRVLGTDHTVAGEIVARKWNLPPVIQYTIRFHHHPLSLPEDVDSSVRKVVAIVHVTDLLCEAFQIGKGGDCSSQTIEEEVWSLLGVGEAECRELVEPVVEEMEKTAELFGLPLGWKSQTKRERLLPLDYQLVQKSPPPTNGQDSGSISIPQELRALFDRFMEAGKQISLLAGLEALLPNIADQARSLAEADGAGILVPKGDCLEVVAAGLDGLMGTTIPAEGSLAGWVARMGESVAIANIAKASPSWEKELFGPAGYLSHLLLPVEWAGKTIAVLSVHSRRERTWEPQEIGLLNTFVGLVAVALENSRLYREAGERAITLRQLNQELEMAIGLKSRFMSTVSHELRTPLSTIMGYSHLIADNIYGEPSAGMLEALKKVIIAADHLLALINNILDFSQIGTGGMVIHREPVDLAVLLGEASASVAAILQGKPIVLSCDYAHSLPTVFTDREQLKQVLGHLLDNAVKFTPEGKIVLRASAAEGGVEILVEDTGIGIELKNQEIIFDGFRQVEDTDTRNYGGLGLGLSMVRCQLELLGGEITVKSQVGQGSTFRVWVPIGKMK